ncbi:cathepsin G-like [Manis javanica]|uniref:cathepsin G-like n=1 Tax=Manis javanica TaxID=9974 RepID=UPI003C6D36CB
MMKPIPPAEWNSPQKPALPPPSFLPPGLKGLAGRSNSCSRLGSLPGKMQLLLLLAAFLLPPGAGAGEIIGGQEARPHSRPYMAYLLIQSPEGLSSCGGSLVREDFVLTAAHCWGRSIMVVLGAHNIRRVESTQQYIPVLRAIRHPEYDQQNIRNDIMLLQLRSRIRQNQAVRTVALPQTQARLGPRASCTVTGWGLVGPNRQTDTLQYVELTVQRDEVCSNRFMSYTGQTQICVGDRRERKSAFLGDSGGPLVCDSVIRGVVSYGDILGTPPAVFTRVLSFMPWIKRTMRRFKQQGQTKTTL